MNRVIAALAILLSGSPVYAGPLDDADAAERRDDYGIAIPIYRSLVDKGNVTALNRLGKFYEFGLGVKRDWVEAAKWYSKAIDAGDESAAVNLCGIGRNWRFMFRNIPIDPAVYGFVEQAAKKGIPVAQFSLGVMNFPLGDSGFDESKGNLREALLWYRRGAEQGDVDSQMSMGMAYAEGLGVPQDYVEAHKWYNLAASHAKYGDFRAAFMKRRDELAAKMTPEQIGKAQTLAREWKSSK
jgi:uncharacterized protein